MLPALAAAAPRGRGGGERPRAATGLLPPPPRGEPPTKAPARPLGPRRSRDGAVDLPAGGGDRALPNAGSNRAGDVILRG